MTRFQRAVFGLVGSVIVLALFACGGGGAANSPTPVPTPTPLVRPNIVLIVVDDLDALSTNQMRFAIDSLASKGLTFSRMLVAQSLCSPSRATILTGMYTHNHGVWDNVPPLGGFPAFRAHEPNSLPVWLKRAGFHTGFFGKYHNSYPADSPDGYIPQGWDEWNAHRTSVIDGRFFGYSMNHNGAVRSYGTTQADYSADVETKLAVNFVRSSAGRPEPLFIMLAPQAPHIPARYADRHGGEFRDAGAPDHLPSFNLGDVASKPSWVRQRSLLTPDEIRGLHQLQRFRLRSMRAVEEQIVQVLQALTDTGRMERTYVFFTSDNGLLMGQHRGNATKGNAYEESINVPFIVRGPGVPVGTTNALVSNIDLAPTIVELASASVSGDMDGRSLVRFLNGQSPANWRNELLTENFGGTPGVVSYTLRTELADGQYAGDWMLNLQDTGGDDHPYSGDYELYCMKGCAGVSGIREDPSQIRNIFRRMNIEHPAFVMQLRARIVALAKCRGATCRT